MKACVIKHNMVMEDEQHYNFDLSYDPKSTQPLIWGISYHEFVRGTAQIEDVDTFYNIYGDLKEHHYPQYGQMPEDHES